ncbi:MAG: methyltransferase domain-containing protein [Bacteriovorax sp.]|nr:methyltransferase domain-containing protein [Bacteriovorax sp.]
MSEKSDFPYLHGFSPVEQERLRRQARFAEHTVYQNVNFSSTKKVLEVGCGVGAQSEILLRRFPDLHLTGIDLSDKQLSAAQTSLGNLEFAKNRYKLEEMSAEDLKFEAESFDGAFLCFVLEHVPDPRRVLSEVRRVLSPGGVIYITEVLNSSFFLDPYSPHVWKYWMAFNDYQYDQKGDPFMGAKLGNLLMQNGYRNIETEVKTWFLDNRYPQKRKEIIEFWSELLLSASEQLLSAKYVDQKTVDGMKAEMKVVANDPNAVFFFSFIQAKAKNGMF